jgi:phosphomannomutase
MSEAGLMVSVSGIRGRVGEALTPEVVARYAAGFGAWARARGKSRSVVVGRDSRVSGPLFHRVVISALESVGCDPIDIGMAPTPTVQLAVEHHHAAGGLAITASHNPIEWNALKFIGPDGLFLASADAASMRESTRSGIAYVNWDELGSLSSDPDAVRRHIDAILDLAMVDVDAIRARRFRVALDCCHGAGSVIMPALLDALGCDVRAIGMTPDGKFPRPPEPVAEQLGELEALVREHKADVGFATDPDVDRLALVLDDAVAPGEDYTLALAARVALRRRPGTVVTNLSTSRVVDDFAEALGGQVVRAPVGEVNVAVKMRDTGAVIGGEGNGGVILPELHLGRDAPLGAALILQLMVDEQRSLSGIVGSMPRYSIVKDKLDRPDAALDDVYAALRERFASAEADTQDGLRLAWPDAWVHVRPSGTEPIIRVIAEAPDEERARDLVRQCREPLEALALR